MAYRSYSRPPDGGWKGTPVVYGGEEVSSSCDDWSFDDHEPLRAEVYPGLTRLPISRDISVDEAARRIRELPMGSTDCTLPTRYALEHGIEIDAFCIYTDNEHNSGEWTPAEALERYRAATGIPARLICVGMTATDYTIADPKDPRASMSSASTLPRPGSSRTSVPDACDVSRDARHRGAARPA